MEKQKQELKEQVKYVLEKYKETRNCDKLLTITVWQVFYSHLLSSTFGTWVNMKKDYVRLINIHKLPSSDTISRFRRFYNSQGMYLPTNEKTALHRRLNIEEWKNVVSPSSMFTTKKIS